jgi:hypothetical protein
MAQQQQTRGGLMSSSAPLLDSCITPLVIASVAITAQVDAIATVGFDIFHVFDVFDTFATRRDELRVAASGPNAAIAKTVSRCIYPSACDGDKCKSFIRAGATVTVLPILRRDRLVIHITSPMILLLLLSVSLSRPQRFAEEMNQTHTMWVPTFWCGHHATMHGCLSPLIVDGCYSMKRHFHRAFLGLTLVSFLSPTSLFSEDEVLPRASRVDRVAGSDEASTADAAADSETSNTNSTGSNSDSEDRAHRSETTQDSQNQASPEASDEAAVGTAGAASVNDTAPYHILYYGPPAIVRGWYDNRLDLGLSQAAMGHPTAMPSVRPAPAPW